MIQPWVVSASLLRGARKRAAEESSAGAQWKGSLLVDRRVRRTEGWLLVQQRRP
jgi:hypothetical protein